METLFFILGIASVVVIATAIVAVVSIVKVTKLQTKVNDESSNLQHTLSNIYQAIAEENRQAHSRVDTIETHFTSQLDSRLDKLTNRTDRSIEELHRLFNDYINNKRK